MGRRVSWAEGLGSSVCGESEGLQQESLSGRQRCVRMPGATCEVSGLLLTPAEESGARSISDDYGLEQQQRHLCMALSCSPLHQLPEDMARQLYTALPRTGHQIQASNPSQTDWPKPVL